MVNELDKINTAIKKVNKMQKKLNLLEKNVERLQGTIEVITEELYARKTDLEAIEVE